jgi:hypothetical protein
MLLTGGFADGSAGGPFDANIAGVVPDNCADGEQLLTTRIQVANA